MFNFIITQNGKRRQWSCNAKREDDAYELAYNKFPDADNIERL